MIRRKVVRKWRRLAGHERNLEDEMVDGHGEFFQGWSRGIAPVVEGRIKVLNGKGTDGARTNGA